MPPRTGSDLAVWSTLATRAANAITTVQGPIACQGRGIHRLQQSAVSGRNELRIDFECVRGQIFAQ